MMHSDKLAAALRDLKQIVSPWLYSFERKDETHEIYAAIRRVVEAAKEAGREEMNSKWILALQLFQLGVIAVAVGAILYLGWREAGK